MDMMDHSPEPGETHALSALMAAHPTVAHATSPIGGESLLQHTARHSSAEKVKFLLNTNTRFGLIEDLAGHTALLLALRSERKPVVRMLLSKIVRNSESQLPAIRQFMRHRVEIAEKYPDLFLEVRHRRSLEIQVPASKFDVHYI